MSSAKAAAIFALFACVACAEEPRARAPAVSFKLTDADVNLVIANVSAARELRLRRPVHVERLAPRRFVERLLADEPAKNPNASALPSSEASALAAFDFAPPPSRRAGVASLDEVLAEQVVGFFDKKVDRVFVPDVTYSSRKELEEQRAVLAHEIHHAVQAQSFPEPPAPRSEDEAIAHLSLLEGDAMVAMIAMLGREGGSPLGRSLRRVRQMMKDVPLSKLSKKSEAMDRALALTRARLEFPYLEGTMFVADLFRTGGFALVNRAYESPPKSTEQILHPEKFLEGDAPRPIADPRPHAGETLLSADTLGELDIRVLLERCLDRPSSERAAAGWGGDRFAVVATPARKLMALWITAWDTEDDAREMEAALGASAACWHDNAATDPRGDLTIGADFSVQRDGKLVAFERGVPPSERAARAAELFSLVGPEPARVPFSDRRLPPFKPLPEPRPGGLRGDFYQNDWLGIAGRIPTGMTATIDREGLDLQIGRPGTLVMGGVAYSTRITTPDQNEKTFGEIEADLERVVEKRNLTVSISGNGPYGTPLGMGVARTWHVDNTDVELQLVLVPICGGTGSVVFVEAYGDSFAKGVLDAWLGSFRWTTPQPIACDFLAPQ